MYDEIISIGVIVPDTSELLTIVDNEWYAAFGDDLFVTPKTPQGVLITAEVAARSNFLQNNALVANQINPNLAGGIFFDAIWALTGGERAKASYSSATVDVTGVPGTILPIGSIVEDNDGNQFASINLITLDGSGNASGVFNCIFSGPIAAPPNTLINIIDGVLGWETATNPAEATLGAYTQSDASGRTERKFTLGLQGYSISEAVIAAINEVEGVTYSPTFRENVFSTPQTIDGVVMLPNSVYVCAAGGSNLDVATAIYSKKSGGCKYSSGASSTAITQTVVDPYSGQSNVIKFDRPNLILITIIVNIAANSATVNPSEAVKTAILAYAAGQVDGEPGFTVGASVSPFELAGAINQYAPNLFIKSVLISTGGTPLPNEIAIALWEQAYTIDSAITVNLV